MIGDGEKQNKPNGKKEKDKPKENGKKYVDEALEKISQFYIELSKSNPNNIYE